MKVEVRLRQMCERLKSRREQVGMTQTEVANAMGVALTTVQKAEKGDLDPHVSTLLSYCEALRIPVAVALGEAQALPDVSPREALRVMMKLVSEQEQQTKKRS